EDLPQCYNPGRITADTARYRSPRLFEYWSANADAGDIYPNARRLDSIRVFPGNMRGSAMRYQHSRVSRQHSHVLLDVAIRRSGLILKLMSFPRFAATGYVLHDEVRCKELSCENRRIAGLTGSLTDDLLFATDHNRILRIHMLGISYIRFDSMTYVIHF